MSTETSTIEDQFRRIEARGFYIIHALGGLGVWPKDEPMPPDIERATVDDCREDLLLADLLLDLGDEIGSQH